MISFFRSIFQSKIGLFLTLAFVVLIAFAFAASDMTGSVTFGGIGGGSEVAEVDGESIGTGDFTTAVRNAHKNVQQQDPSVDMQRFVDEGGLDAVLERMISSYVMAAFADDHGVAISKRLIDSEIRRIPGFKNLAGKFDEATYRAALQQAGISEGRLREDLGRALLADALLMPVQYGVKMPEKMAIPYARLALEKRRGKIALIPSIALASKTPPTDKQIEAYYRKNAARYRQEERRSLQYIRFTGERFAEQAKVSKAEIEKLYNERKAQYAAREERQYAQLVTPTEAAATALANKVAGGMSFDAAAKEAGLAAATVDYRSKERVENENNKAFASAIFATPKGKMTKPVKTALGWQIAEVRNIRTTGAKTLEQATPELEKALLASKTRAAIDKFLDTMDDRLSSGSTLEDIAREEKLEVVTTPALYQNGQADQNPQYKPDEVVQKILPTAFNMQEGDSAQMAEITPGTLYAAFDVRDIRPAAPRPLNSIKDRVKTDYVLSESSKKAKALADKIAKTVKTGAQLEAALKASKLNLPAIEDINTSREQILRFQGRVPPPVALLFSMASKSSKVLNAQRNIGWYIVVLDEIEEGDPSKAPQLVAMMRQQVAQVLSDEYAQQFVNAIEASAKVKRNPSAVKRVRDELTGANQGN